MFFYEFRSDDTLTLARLTAVQNICPISIIKVGQQFCEMSLYENTEELFGDFEENDYLSSINRKQIAPQM